MSSIICWLYKWTHSDQTQFTLKQKVILSGLVYKFLASLALLGGGAIFFSPSRRPETALGRSENSVCFFGYLFVWARTRHTLYVKYLATSKSDLSKCYPF